MGPGRLAYVNVMNLSWFLSNPWRAQTSARDEKAQILHGEITEIFCEITILSNDCFANIRSGWW